MNEHAKKELIKIVQTQQRSPLPSSAAKRKPVKKDRQGEVEGTTEPILLHSNDADTINGYYILLQTLADKEDRAFGETVPKLVAEDIRQWGLTNGDRPGEQESANSSDWDRIFTPERVLSELRGVVKKIEIVRDQVSELVYFPVPKTCVQQLNDGFVVDWRQSFYHNLDRDNANARVTDLVNKIDKYHAVHMHQKWISDLRICCGLRPLHLLQKAGLICDKWTLYNTIAINILLIIGFTDPEETQSKLEWVNMQLYIQGLLHMYTSTVKVVVHFMQYPLLEVVQEQMMMEDYCTHRDELVHFSRPGYWKRAAQLGSAGKLHCCARILSWRKLIFNDEFGKTVYMILCIVCSALGALVDPFFFAFHLLELFFVIQLLQVALDAVGRNAKQLFYAVAMSFILTYCYAVLGWKLIIADDNIPFEYGFNGDPTWGPNSTGVTFYDWIIVHWEVGLRDGPQHSALWRTGSTPVQYIALSITYYIVIVLIMGAVISGIIIDAFSADRSEKERIKEDDKEFDFISGLPRSEFEKLGLQFDDYVKQFHDPWNYLYYTVYLAEKNETAYTGQESYVWKMVQAKDPHFFPTLRAGKHIVPNPQNVGERANALTIAGGASGPSTDPVRMRDFARLEAAFGKSACLRSPGGLDSVC
jgi:hypothetical protein